MMVSGNNQDGSKRNSGLLCSIDFQRINIKYIKKMRKNDNTNIKITTQLVSPYPYCLVITKGRRWK